MWNVVNMSAHLLLPVTVTYLAAIQLFARLNKEKYVWFMLNISEFALLSYILREKL